MPRMRCKCCCWITISGEDQMRSLLAWQTLSYSGFHTPELLQQTPWHTQKLHGDCLGICSACACA